MRGLFFQRKSWLIIGRNTWMAKERSGGRIFGFLLCWNIGSRKTMSGKKKILLFADWYEPAFKAGGPIRSCVNFVQHMREDYEIFVFTSDRDIGSTQALSGIVSNQWIGQSGD